jgi:hypothetical protein
LIDVLDRKNAEMTKDIDSEAIDDIIEDAKDRYASIRNNLHYRAEAEDMAKFPLANIRLTLEHHPTRDPYSLCCEVFNILQKTFKPQEYEIWHKMAAEVPKRKSRSSKCLINKKPVKKAQPKTK